MVQSATERATHAAHETIDRVGEKAARAEEQLRESAAQAAERAREVRDQAAEQLRSGVDSVTGYIQKNPLQAAAIAFAAGLLVSTLLRRR
jgi:ElaB/YqjD/DUF883 family membrane-anchored ribosome-binding protein